MPQQKRKGGREDGCEDEARGLLCSDNEGGQHSALVYSATAADAGAALHMASAASSEVGVCEEHSICASGSSSMRGGSSLSSSTIEESSSKHEESSSSCGSGSNHGLVEAISVCKGGAVSCSGSGGVNCSAKQDTVIGDAPPAVEKVALCRICLEDDCVSSLEVPCSCTGSQQYAHHACIQRWVVEKGHLLCEICGQEYTVQYDVPPQPPVSVSPQSSSVQAVNGQVMARELGMRMCFHCAGMIIVGMLLLIGMFNSPPPPNPNQSPSPHHRNEHNSHDHHHPRRWSYYYGYDSSNYDDAEEVGEAQPQGISTLAVFLALVLFFLLWALFTLAMRKIRRMQFEALHYASTQGTQMVVVTVQRDH